MNNSNSKECRAKKILVCSNYAWTVLNFRMPLILSLIDAGYDVCVLTQYDGYETLIENQGVSISPLYISRKGVNPFVDLGTFFSIFTTLVKLRPSYLLLFTIKPVIYGAIAARFCKIPAIVMMTGLGTSFISESWITKVVHSLYKLALRKVAVAFFQNTADRDLFEQRKLSNPSSVRLSPGSGIDLNRYRFQELRKREHVSFLLVARMVFDKGVREYVDAAQALKAKYPDVSFQLLGPLGVQNRTAISNETMSRWVERGAVTYLGETDDVSPYIQDSTCVVLPSYREGTSRVLLEAAALGRPIVTTDVPGCREVVDHGSNGFLCKVKDPYDLATQLEKLILLSHKSRKEMGLNGRRKIEQQFCSKVVSALYLEAIRDIDSAL
jgi:glycosyltransferase involved in cell wall biosynthesis